METSNEKPIASASSRPVPTMLGLQRMVDSGLVEEAVAKINFHKLPFEVIGGKVIHAGNSTEAWLARYITADKDMVEMKEEARLLSKVDDPVLITGETGTGKEIIARILHGDRDSKKFVAFNCAGVPDTLIEAELFGHTSQAFTGARESKIGLMKQADDGTLFLDEIGEMPMTVQAKLLRTLQEKKIRKLGSTVEESITCRIVCATNQDLGAMINESKFRKDLYARIAVFELKTKSLLQRPDDIKLIIESLDGGKDLIEATGDKWGSIDLTFNVRSLQAHVRRFVVLGKLPI